MREWKKNGGGSSSTKTEKADKPVKNMDTTSTK